MGALDDAMNADREREALAREQQADPVDEANPLVDDFVALMHKRGMPTSPYFDSRREWRKLLRTATFHYEYAGECWPAWGTGGFQVVVTTGGEVIACMTHHKRYPRQDSGNVWHKYDDRAKQEFRAKRPVNIRSHHMPKDTVAQELPRAARRLLGEI